MLLKELTPAARNPVPLREFAAHLRLAHGFSDDGSEDGLLELYLRNATAMIERRTAQALISRVHTLQIGCWDRKGHLVLPIGPVEQIERIQFISTSATTELDPEDWVLQPGTQRQRVTGPLGAALWPIPQGSIAELRFTAGYGGSWNSVPDDLRQAVLLLAAHLYENRFGELEGSDPSGVPAGVLSIVAQHAPVRL